MQEELETSSLCLYTENVQYEQKELNCLVGS